MIDTIEVKRRLLALLNDQKLVDDYLAQFGPSIDIRHIKEVKEKFKNNNPAELDETPGDDPIFDISVKCPVCYNSDIISHELRAKSQQIIQSKFLVPVYQGAGGFRTVDFTLIAVTVCPKCLFASPDRKDFGRHDSTTHSYQKTQLSSNIISSLQEKVNERKSLLKITDNYLDHFKRPRNLEAAIDSYRLAISRAKVEAWYEQPYSFYKLGAYSLRIAKIMKDNFLDNSTILKEALGYFEEAFRTSNCPSEEIEMQVIYLISALYLKLDDQKKANSYIAVFSNLHNTRITEMRTNPKLSANVIDKWAEKSKRLWEDRDDPNLFKDD